MILVNPYEIKLECNNCGKEIGYEKYYGEEPTPEELEPDKCMKVDVLCMDCHGEVA